MKMIKELCPFVDECDEEIEYGRYLCQCNYKHNQWFCERHRLFTVPRKTPKRWKISEFTTDSELTSDTE